MTCQATGHESPGNSVDSSPDSEPRDTTAEALSLDLSRQLRALSVALGEELAPRAAIYLDTCYWVHLRDALQGSADLRMRELLGRLRAAVQAGQAFCPVSESTIFELLKQSDPDTRHATAQLMDELSAGVAIAGGQDRMGTELAHFIHTHLPANIAKDLHPLRNLVWIRVAAVMGIRVPYLPEMTPDQAMDLQRSVVKRLWRDLSLDDLLAHQSHGFEDDDFASVTRQMNVDVAAHQAELRSFQHAYRLEAAGAADLCGDVVMQIVADVAAQHGQTAEALGTEPWRRMRASWCHLLAEALRKGPSRDQLRSMHAMAALHAAFRWNAGQQFEPNDLYDFEHATAALAHCQAFFTERPLWHAVTAGNVALDKHFGCDVVWKVDDALAVVANLARRS